VTGLKARTFVLNYPLHGTGTENRNYGLGKILAPRENWAPSIGRNIDTVVEKSRKRQVAVTWIWMKLVANSRCDKPQPPKTNTEGT